MNKVLQIKKKILLLTSIFLSFSTFAQVPYNIVMNIYNDPKTTMAFNWFTGTGVTGGTVKIMLGGNIVNSVATNYTYTQYSGYTVNKAVVTGLTPNTTYSFQVGGALY